MANPMTTVGDGVSTYHTMIAKVLYYQDVGDELPFGVPPFDDLEPKYQLRYFEPAEKVLMELATMPRDEFDAFMDRFRAIREAV